MPSQISGDQGRVIAGKISTILARAIFAMSLNKTRLLMIPVLNFLSSILRTASRSGMTSGIARATVVSERSNSMNKSSVNFCCAFGFSNSANI